MSELERLMPLPPMCGYKRRNRKPDPIKPLAIAVSTTVPTGCRSHETLRMEAQGVIVRADLYRGVWSVNGWLPNGQRSTPFTTQIRSIAIAKMGEVFALGVFRA
jgi:hypothetical protein